MALTIDLDGRVALVTGGVRGVGAGIARQLLEAGADVVVCARHEPEHLPAAGGRTARFRMADVRDVAQARRLVDDVVADLGRLDVLVNNAGGAPYADAATASPRFHAGVVDLNLMAPLALSQAANTVMQDQDGGGCIVMVSSVSGVRPSPGTAAYGAAKAALNSLTTSLAIEWAPLVRVTALAVGLVRTEQSHLHYGGDEGLERVAATVPLGRLAEPDDVGRVCVFLASPLAGYVTGSVIAVHGGGERPAFLAAAAGTGAEDQTRSTREGRARDGDL